jgi:hypothetical protein
MRRITRIHMHACRVLIRSTHKMTEPELIGQIGVISKLEQGAVDVFVPKLQATIRLQQRYLAHVPDPPESLRRIRATSTGVWGMGGEGKEGRLRWRERGGGTREEVWREGRPNQNPQPNPFCCMHAPLLLSSRQAWTRWARPASATTATPPPPCWRSTAEGRCRRGCPPWWAAAWPACARRCGSCGRRCS